MRRKIIAVIFLMSIINLPVSIYAFGGGVVRSIGRETVEIAERKTVKEVMCEAGEVGVERLGKFIAKHGDEGRHLFNIMGDDIIELTARHGREVVEMCAAHSQEAAIYLAKHADETLPVWRQFGKEGTSLFVRYPGLGRTLLESCGSRGIVAARKLSRENLNRLAFFTKRISKENLDELLTWLLSKGDEVMEFVWRHKKVLLAGGGVYALLKNYPDGFMTTAYSNGKPVRTQTEHNFFQHITNQTLKSTGHWLGQSIRAAIAYSWLPLIGLGIFILWLRPILVKLWYLPRKRRSNTINAEKSCK